MHLCEEGDTVGIGLALNHTTVHYIILARELMDLHHAKYFTSGLLRRLSNGPMDLKDRKAVRTVVFLRDVEGDSSLSYERRVFIAAISNNFPKWVSSRPV